MDLEKRVIIDFMEMRKIIQKRNANAYVQPRAYSVVVPKLLSKNVFFKDEDGNVIKFTESMRYSCKDVFNNAFSISGKFPINKETEKEYTKEEIKHRFSIANILINEDEEMGLYAKIYIGGGRK